MMIEACSFKSKCNHCVSSRRTSICIDMHFQINRDNVRLNFRNIYGSISEHDKNGIKFSVASKFDCFCRVGGRQAKGRIFLERQINYVITS